MDKIVWAIRGEDAESVKSVMTLMTQGNVLKAFEIMQIVMAGHPYSIEKLSHTFQMMAIRRPFDHQSVFSEEEWQAMCKEFEEVREFRQLADILKAWAEVASSRLGGF